GGVPASAALNQIMVHSKILNIVQIAGAVFVIAALVFRSAVAGALVLLPLALTVVVNFGVMGWLGMRLNIPNAISLAMGIGIGSDYAIYLIYRLREEISAGKELPEAVRATLNTAGQGPCPSTDSGQDHGTQFRRQPRSGFDLVGHVDARRQKRTGAGAQDHRPHETEAERDRQYAPDPLHLAR